MRAEVIETSDGTKIAAPRQGRRLAPADVGVRRLGHFGPFRSEHERQLWPRMGEWIAGLSARAA